MKSWKPHKFVETRKNHWDNPWPYYEACWAAVMTIIKGRGVYYWKNKLKTIRESGNIIDGTKYGLSKKIYRNDSNDVESCYWFELEYLLRDKIGDNKCVYLRKPKSLAYYHKRIPKGTYLVLLNDHVIVYRNRKVYDNNNNGEDVENYKYKFLEVYNYVKIGD